MPFYRISYMMAMFLILRNKNEKKKDFKRYLAISDNGCNFNSGISFSCCSISAKCKTLELSLTILCIFLMKIDVHQKAIFIFCSMCSHEKTGCRILNQQIE